MDYVKMAKLKIIVMFRRTEWLCLPHEAFECRKEDFPGLFMARTLIGEE